MGTLGQPARGPDWPRAHPRLSGKCALEAGQPRPRTAPVPAFRGATDAWPPKASARSDLWSWIFSFGFADELEELPARQAETRVDSVEGNAEGCGDLGGRALVDGVHDQHRSLVKAPPVE